MDGTHEPYAIWTDGDVMEAMHAMHATLCEWEAVGAAEDVDLDAMEDVQDRFTMALGDFETAMRQYHKRQRKNR